MKIGINSRLFQKGKGGIPHYIECLYTELLKIDKKNSYVFFQTGENEKIGSTKISKIPNGTVGAFLFDNFLVNNLIKKEKVNVFHGPSCVLPIWKRRGVKYIVTVHDLAFLKIPQIYGFLYKMYYKLALSMSLKKADVIITDSKSAKDDIVEFFKVKESKIKVVPLGVDTAFWEANQKERIIEEKYFLSVATHSKRKNIIGALKAFSLSKNLGDFKYVIIGTVFDKEYKKELDEVIEKLGLTKKVLVMGYVKSEDLISLYQNADFFVYPCYYDGFSFPVLEAMASRCPVIASNNSAFIELVPNQNWLVDPYNIEDIKDKMEKIVKLSDEERDTLIKENYAFAKRFTWQNTVLKMMDIFNNLS